MTYYMGNALCDEIRKSNIDDLVFASEDYWHLVYGDQKRNPKLLLEVQGVDNEYYASKYSPEDECNFIIPRLSRQCNIPFISMRFRTDLYQIDEFLVSVGIKSYKPMSLNEFRDLMRDYQLPVSATSTGKYLNDKDSSAFHKWQRNSLGRNLKVSDIDLCRVDDTGRIVEIFELKRSFYTLENWEPFKDDYNNFRLLSNLCQRGQIKFTIIYNQRITSPNFFDDVSKLKLFDVNFSNNPPITEQGIITLEKFLSS